MAVPILIPKATITLEEANILCWRKQEGEHVQKDEALFEMETDKVVVEVPSPADGVLLRIDVRAGQASVEASVGWIGAAGEILPELGPPSPPFQAAAATLDQPAPSHPSPSGDFFASSPAARRRARELGLDLTRIQGTGPGGRITEADVTRAERRP
jgi:pyruvate dehydrogenase E2 component (dihydrolipoamide acetyltransferase)